MNKNKGFYKKLLNIYIPILVQNGFSQFLSLVDSVMIGSLGTLTMNGVAITARLLSTFQMTLFGALSGPGIFMAQYYGNKDKKSFKKAFDYQIVFGGILLVLATCLFLIFGTKLISLFLESELNTVEQVEITLTAGLTYLRIITIGLLPFVGSQIFATTLRSIGNTLLPMISSVVAMLVNLLFNFLLIKGHLGFPTLGVTGAAIATLLSRFIEFAILFIGWIKSDNDFLKGIISRVELNGKYIKLFALKSAPLLVNESLYSLSFTVLDLRYSIYGLHNMAAINITSTVYWFAIIACTSMGTAASIIIGQQLGAGNIEEAKKEDNIILRLNLMLGILFGAILFLVAPIMPNLYEVELEVKQLATILLRINGIMVPITAIYFTSYYTLRAGGKTLLTMLFDSGYNWVFMIPVAYVLTEFTSLPIITAYVLIKLVDVPKAILGLILLKKGIWIVNLTNQN